MAATIAELSVPIKGNNANLKFALAESKSEIRKFATESASAFKGAFTPVQDAFKLLGVTSQQSLDKMASESIRAFNIIKQSGTTTAHDLSRAWESMQQHIGAAMNNQHVSRFSQSMQAASQHAQQLGSSVQAASQQVSSGLSGISIAGIAVGGVLANMATSAVATLKNLAASAVSTGFSFNSLKEQSTIAFTSFIGSADGAKQHLKDLFQFAATTPFEAAPLIKASQMLQAVGISGQQVIPIMTGLGNALSAMGNISSDAINHVVKAITDMKSKGTVSLEELKRQLGNFIPAIKLIAENMGISQAELLKKVEAGAISVDEVISNLVEGANKRFGNLMEQQSHTLQGLMSTLHDFFAMSMGELTSGVFDKTRDGLQKLVDILPSLQQGFKDAGDVIGDVINIIGQELSPVFKDLTEVVGRNKATWQGWGDTIRAVVTAASRTVALNFGFIIDAINRADSVLKHFNFSILESMTGIGALAGQARRLGGLLGIGGGEQAPPKQEFETVWYEPPDPSPGIRSAGAKAKKAIKEVWDGLNEETEAQVKKWISHQSIGIDLSVKEWNRWPKELREQLKAQAKAFDEANNEMDLKLAKFVAAFGFGTDKILERINKFAEASGIKWKFTVDQLLRMSPQLVSELDQQSMAWEQNAEAAEDNAAKLRALQILYPSLHPNIEGMTKVIVDMTKAFATATKGMGDNSKVIEDAAKRMSDTWAAESKEWLQTQAETSRKLKKEFDDLAKDIPQSFNKIIDALLKSSNKVGDVFLKEGIRIKGIFADIFGVVDNLPGRVGDALRRTVDEFERWYRTIDSIVRLIERLLGESETEGLTGVINSVAKSIGGFFKKAQAETKNQSETWADQVAKALGGLGGESEEAGEDSGKSFSEGFLGKLGLIASGVATFFGSRGQGKVAGVIGGAAAGAQIGTAILPGWGTAIGAAAGAIAGLFGAGGPSDEEKRRAEEDRRLQIEQLKQSLAKGYEELKQSILTTARDFIKFVDEMAGSAQIPKDVLNKFVNNMVRTLSKLADAMKAIAPKITAETQRAAEQLLPAIDLMSRMPLAFDAINKHFSVADSQIDLFFTDLDKIAEKIGQSAEASPNKIEKHIKKFATRLSPAVDLMKGVGELIKQMFETKEMPSDASFGIWEAVIGKIIAGVGRLSDQFDKWWIKTMAAFAEKAKSGLSFWKEATDAIRATKDVPSVSQSDVDNIIGGIELFLTALVKRLSDLAADELNKVASLAPAITSVASAIKNWAETSGVIRDYTAISAEVWQQVVDDFKKALQLIHLLIADALLFVDEAKTFDELVTIGAQHLESGFSKFANAINFSASMLNGTLSNLNAMTTFSNTLSSASFAGGGGSGLSSSAFSSVGSQSFTSISTPSVFQSSPNFASSGQGQQTVVHIHVNAPIQGSLIHQTRVQETIIAAIVEGVKRGQLKGGGAIQFAVS